ncbi:MAG: hypothetical protein CMP91_03665 [Gammaproteobacteria bacterium]|nr:hypothetical protein [Gammaproteobacteria bacterium]|tara:strand:+ start:198635 stop:200320 length:1686 start_codon:yes stop_codon:yes gene_type:complete
MIEANEVTFFDLFSGNDKQIRVPDYQRGYSWENRNVIDFYNDIVSYAHPTNRRHIGEMYFLGPIVLMPNIDKNLNYIVDGQQRLATFIILLSVIRDLSLEFYGIIGNELANEIQKNYIDSTGPQGGHRWSILLGDLDQAFFQAYIQKRDRVEGQVPRNKSNGLIKQARNIIDSNLRNIISTDNYGFEYLDQINKCLTRKTVMVSITVKGERDAMNVFERINVRGKPLTESDLVRHLLISSSKANDRSRVRQCWDEIESLLGRTKSSTDLYLHHMWQSRFGNTKSSKLYDLVCDYLDTSEISALEFAQNCVNDCYIYSYILLKESRELHFDSRDSVWAIHNIFGITQALPLLMSVYRRFEKTKQFTEIIKDIESLIIRHNVFSRFEIKDLSEAFSKAIISINNASSKENAIKDVKKIFLSVSPDLPQMINGIKGSTKIKSRQATYILRQLEDYYSHPDGSLISRATLEHIFPQNAKSPKWTISQIERLSPLVNHLGNLALLSGQDNSSVSNKKYGEKKDIYRRSVLKLTSEIPTENSWGRTQIFRRSEKLAKLANEKWHIHK